MMYLETIYITIDIVITKHEETPHSKRIVKQCLIKGLSQCIFGYFLSFLCGSY